MALTAQNTRVADISDMENQYERTVKRQLEVKTAELNGSCHRLEHHL